MIPKTLPECKKIGRELEDAVASRLKELGLTVYQDLYVPRRPGTEKRYQVDVLAMSDSAIFIFECKNRSGSIHCDSTTGEWTWHCGSKHGELFSPVLQVNAHARAIERQLGCNVIPVALLSDKTWYTGDPCPYIIHFHELAKHIDSVKGLTIVSPTILGHAKKLCDEWAAASATIRRDHIADVNHARNEKPLIPYKQGAGVQYYCVVVEIGKQPYFYYYTDEQGHHWGIEQLEDATLYRSEEEARIQSWEIPGSAVCTLEWGYLENVDELPGEMDDLTPDEYAYEIGARPW